MGKKNRISFREAMEIADDDLPDGAYWAMCHEIAGLDYGDGFAELAAEDKRPIKKRKRCKKAKDRK